jgi:hypothetical protein
MQMQLGMPSDRPAARVTSDLGPREPLHLKVFIHRNGDCLNEETEESKDGTEYELEVEPTDPYDELPDRDCERMRLRSVS